jgi:hypothetical protein
MINRLNDSILNENENTLIDPKDAIIAALEERNRELTSICMALARWKLLSISRMQNDCRSSLGIDNTPRLTFPRG